MTTDSTRQTRALVRDHCATVALSDPSRGSAGGCCAPGPAQPDASEALGYDPAMLASLPSGPDLALGCGNPHAIASLQAGETVLDLGSGAGIDCILAAARVGGEGQVIGVDMTAEMIARARVGVAKTPHSNIEFRLGEIEHLPVADRSVGVVLSNCVVNLSLDQAAVYREVARVLRPGGRVAISDVVAIADMPETVANDIAALTGCVSGAARADQIRAHLESAGLVDVSVAVKPESRASSRSGFRGMVWKTSSPRLRSRLRNRP
ncbi:MAG: arsenite methyltransferase [Myxococcota bacterium]|jgi:arsenite methyltransferase